MKNVYIFLSVLYLLVLVLLGFFALNKPIVALINPNEGWLAWLIIILTTTLTLFFGYYQVLLEGINKVALVQRTFGIVNLLGLPVILGVLLFKPTLIAIVFVYQLVAVSATLSIVYFGIKETTTLGINKYYNSFDRSLFFLVWESAWKSGITTIIGNVVKHISAILVAQLFAPAQSASFLFTKRLFDVLERFTMTTFQARIPLIAKYRGRGDFDRLIPLLKQTQYISYSVYLVGYFILLFFGQSILELINSKVALGSFMLIFLFSINKFFSRWASMTLAISNQSNTVIEHLSAIIYIIVYITCLYLMLNILDYGVESFLLAELVAIMISIWIVINIAYRTLHTTFFAYEYRVMFPIFLTLVIINFIFYRYFS